MSFNIMLHPADLGGCAHYRLFFPSWALRTIFRNIKIIDSCKLIPIPQFYQDLRLLRIQRQVSNEQCGFFMNFLKPCCEKTGTWTNYEIDDCIHKDDIPKYNLGWAAYQNDDLMKNIKTVMNASDFVTVTCPALKEYYTKRFEVPEDKILIVPNFLPKWWMGNLFDVEKARAKYNRNKTTKHRIGFVSSSTHFDAYLRNGGVDDFTHITNFIKANIDKYQWVFVGGVPAQLTQEYKDKKIEFYPGFDILNYPSQLDALNVSLVIAPLIDSTFNKCKSNIKFVETSALGIPCICQNIETYNKYTNLLFKDESELQNQIDYVLDNETRYVEIVKMFRNIVDNGDANSPNGWWLEKNLHYWLPIYQIQQKTLKFDLTSMVNGPVASTPDIIQFNPTIIPGRA